MAEIQITKWEKLLQEAESEGILALAKQKQSPPTLIEIIGCQTKENFYNNILAFFLQTDEAHGMGDLVVSSLLEAVDIETDDVNVSNVVREYTTYTTDTTDKKKRRIDLLIETRRYIIGIENKIYARANNDFKEYSKTINTLANNDSGSSDERKPVCILLSLFKQEKHEDFIPITYKEFFEKIEKNLGKYTTDAHPEYLQFLLHFIKTIRNLTMKNELDQEMKKFLEKENNAKKAEFFYKKCREYKAMLYTSLFSEENLNHFKDKSSEIIHTWIWKKQHFVIECKHGNRLPNFVIDMWPCFPYHAETKMFFRGDRDGYYEDLKKRVKKIIEKYKLLEYFKRNESSIENFCLKDPIPIDEITKEDNVLNRLVDALIDEHNTIING